MTARQRRAWFGWTLAAMAAAGCIHARMELTTDLAWFLPAPRNAAETVLLNGVGDGPGGRMLFITLRVPGADDLAGASDRFRDALAATGDFRIVLNGGERLAWNDVPAPLRRFRYLLSDVDLSQAGLRAALEQRLRDFAIAADPRLEALVAADPYFAVERLAGRLTAVRPGDPASWIDRDSRTVLLAAESRAPSFDPGAQAGTLASIRHTAAAQSVAIETLGGVPAHAVELQATVTHEARSRTLWAGVAVAAIVFAGFRSARLIPVAALPLLLGALFATAATALMFGRVHGITLAFGFTLFGVALDYPLHAYSHRARSGRAEMPPSVWRTLLLSSSSTILACLALAGSGSTGLAQLGVFSAVGLAVALAATRTLLPDLLGGIPRDVPGDDPHTLRRDPVANRNADGPARTAPGQAAWVLVLAAALLAGACADGPWWADDPASMTPVDPARLAEDTTLRARAGAPDLRHVLVVPGNGLEATLVRAERVERHLREAMEGAGDPGENLADDLAGLRMVTTLLPSRATARARLERVQTIGNPADWLAQAASGLPFNVQAFAPFVAHLRETAASGALPEAADYAGTSLEPLLDNGLVQADGRWYAIGMLYGLEDPAAVASLLSAVDDDVALVDLRAAASAMVGRYRLRAFAALAAGALAVLVVLVWRIGFGRRLLFVAGTMTSAAAVALALPHVLLGPLSLFNLAGTILVIGLGLDYALFLTRETADGRDAADSRRAVGICAASTVAAFALLATSGIPMLRGLGTTVATGVAMAYLVTRLGTPHPAD